MNKIQKLHEAASRALSVSFQLTGIERLSFSLMLEPANFKWDEFEKVFPDFTKLPAREQIQITKEVVDSKKDFYGLRKQGYLYIYHSFLSQYFLTPDSLSKIVSGVLRNGIRTGYLGDATERYKDLAGNPINAIWTSSVKPHNEKVLWVACELPDEWAVHNTDIHTERDLEEAKSFPTQILCKSIPSQFVKYFCGIPVNELK